MYLSSRWTNYQLQSLPIILEKKHNYITVQCKKRNGISDFTWTEAHKKTQTILNVDNSIEYPNQGTETWIGDSHENWKYSLCNTLNRKVDAIQVWIIVVVCITAPHRVIIIHAYFAKCYHKLQALFMWRFRNMLHFEQRDLSIWLTCKSKTSLLNWVGPI